MAERDELEIVRIQARTLGSSLSEAYREMLTRLGDVPDGTILGFGEGPQVTLLELLDIAEFAGHLAGVVEGIEMGTGRKHPGMDPRILTRAQTLAVHFHSTIAEHDLGTDDEIGK